MVINKVRNLAKTQNNFTAVMKRLLGVIKKPETNKRAKRRCRAVDI